MSRVDCCENCDVTVEPNPDVRKLLAEQDGLGRARSWQLCFLEFRCFVTDHTSPIDSDEVISKQSRDGRNVMS